jgi:hypothetical protein
MREAAPRPDVPRELEPGAGSDHNVANDKGVKMAGVASRGGWVSGLTKLALLLSIGGLVAALIAALGTGLEAWHFRTGFTILRYAFFAAIAGALLALVGLVAARRRRVGKLAMLNLVALVVGLGFVLYLGSQIRTARTVPAIHEASTNLDDLPQFGVLKLREDYLQNVPDNDDPKLKALDSESRWKALHRQAYGDLRTARVPWAVPEAVKRVEQVARSRGWDIVRSDPRAGVVEATETTLFFRFKDDVVVRVRPEPSGTGSLVDVRSISRVGGSDVGLNAKRIRAFLADLQAA